MVKESENESDSVQDKKETNVFKTMDNRGPTVGRTFNADLEKVQSEEEQGEKEDPAELEALQMITSCMSEMSIKYEQMGKRFQEKLDSLEDTSKNLSRRFDALQGKRDATENTIDNTNASTQLQTIDVIGKQ